MGEDNILENVKETVPGQIGIEARLRRQRGQIDLRAKGEWKSTMIGCDRQVFVPITLPIILGLRTVSSRPGMSAIRAKNSSCILRLPLETVAAAVQSDVMRSSRKYRRRR